MSSDCIGLWLPGKTQGDNTGRRKWIARTGSPGLPRFRRINYALLSQQYSSFGALELPQASLILSEFTSVPQCTSDDNMENYRRIMHRWVARYMSLGLSDFSMKQLRDYDLLYSENAVYKNNQFDCLIA